MEQLSTKTLFEQLEGLETDELEFVYFTIEAILKERGENKYQDWAEEVDGAE